MAAQFGSLLRQIAENADRSLSDFAIDDANRQVIPAETATFGFSDVLGLYRASPADRAALRSRYGAADETLTFADLELKSNRIARMLAAKGVTREVPVGLWIERSPAFVAALLGVLKAAAPMFRSIRNGRSNAYGASSRTVTSGR